MAGDLYLVWVLQQKKVSDYDTLLGTGVAPGLLLEAVFLTEFLYPTGGVHDFLLTGIERVT